MNKSPASASSTPRSGGVRTGDRKTTPGSGTQRRGVGGAAQKVAGRRPFGRGANQAGSQPQRRDNRSQQGQQNDRRGMRGNQRPQQQRSEYPQKKQWEQTPDRRQDQRTGWVSFVIESLGVAKDCCNLKVSVRFE